MGDSAVDPEAWSRGIQSLLEWFMSYGWKGIALLALLVFAWVARGKR